MVVNVWLASRALPLNSTLTQVDVARQKMSDCQLSGALTPLLVILLWSSVICTDLASSLINERIILKSPSDGEIWHPDDITLQQCGFFVSKSGSTPYASRWWGLRRPFSGLTASHWVFLNSGAGRTKAVCQSEQLVLCHNPHVTEVMTLFQ